MPQPRTADVVIVTDGSTPTARRCLRSVLEHSGPTLHRLIVVTSPSTQDGLSPILRELSDSDPRICVIRQTWSHGRAVAYNNGLAEREADAVVLSDDVEVHAGWLTELAGVAYSGNRTACASPLTDHDGPCSVRPVVADGDDPPVVDVETVRDACAHLPRWSVAPLLSGVCCYLRGDVIDSVGLLDPSYTSGNAAVDDWVMRAQVLGFLAKRANHVFVRRLTEDDPVERREHVLDMSHELLARRHPFLQPQLDRYQGTLDRTLAAHAVRLRATGQVRVAYDLRSLPREQVGTRTYGVSLAKALAEIPEIDLTLLVRDLAQAEGLSGRIVSPETWRDDVDVIHRPMQIIDPHDLSLFYQSSAHLVITYQDLIGYRIPVVFPSDAVFQGYRATSSLSLQGVQRILAYSESAAREIVEEFGIPRDEVAVVPLGVDAAWFSSKNERDPAILRKLRLPRRYFFSVATDFPHKNLPNLLEAYALFRARWSGGDPPGLVLAGYTTGCRQSFYEQLESGSKGKGLTLLGPVSADQLRVLYQHSEALIFPSLYEGFGLPPLEAMAAGTAVIAMAISSVPEVGGDCVLYPDGFSPAALARAMERLSGDPALRERLRAGGLERVTQFRWEKTARETLEVYRAAVLQPSARSVAMRRRLREAVLNWSDSVVQQTASPGAHGCHPVVEMEPLGIRNAWNALNGAFSRRVRREMGRFRPTGGRRSA